MEKKGIDYETTALRCPFCNCEPDVHGFLDDPEKESNVAFIHCPGCGVDMKEVRRDSEEEGETIKRLIKKWNLRNITLGVNINKLIDDVNRKSVAVSRLLGQQIEVAGYLFKFSNPIVNKSFTPQERHAEILNGIKDLQRQVSFWRLTAAIFMAMTTVAIFLLK